MMVSPMRLSAVFIVIVMSSLFASSQEQPEFAGEDLFSTQQVRRQTARFCVGAYVLPFALTASNAEIYGAPADVSRTFWGVSAGLMVSKFNKEASASSWTLSVFFQPYNETREERRTHFAVVPGEGSPTQFYTDRTMKLDYYQTGLSFCYISNTKESSPFVRLGASAAISFGLDRVDEEHAVSALPDGVQLFPSRDFEREDETYESTGPGSYTRTVSYTQPWFSYLGGEMGAGYNVGIPGGVFSPYAAFDIAWIASPNFPLSMFDTEAPYAAPISFGLRFGFLFTIGS